MMFRSALKFFGSLGFAVFLIAVLGMILITSTTMESLFGTPYVQRFFYRAGWFDFFLALIAVNILASMLTRFPYKKKHTGFVMTHIGILILLSGAFMTRLTGVEGQIALFEGETADRLTQDLYEFSVAGPGGETENVGPLESLKGRPRSYPLFGGRAELRVHRILENAAPATYYEEGPETAPENHAVQFTLKSVMADTTQHFHLAEKDPEDPHSSVLRIGPAVIQIKKKEEKRASDADIVSPDETKPMLMIKNNTTGEISWLDPSESEGKEVVLEMGGFTIRNLSYYPHARVDGKELFSASEDPVNPAVSFEIHDAEGNIERRTRFALFPDFESMHGRTQKQAAPFTIVLTAPEGLQAHPPGQSPTLTFYYDAAGMWTYTFEGSKSSHEGEIHLGQNHPAGWMDFSFTVDALYQRAVVEKKIEPAPSRSEGELAAEISLVGPGNIVSALERFWVTAGRDRTFKLTDGVYRVALARKTVPLPMRLTLEDFRKIDYPATNNPVSYESDVVLKSKVENLEIRRTISMNKPLDYEGWRIFQSSYLQDPEWGEASVFTVAKNPGIALIYSGAVILFLGAFLVFFVPPFSSLKQGNEG